MIELLIVFEVIGLLFIWLFIELLTICWIIVLLFIELSIEFHQLDVIELLVLNCPIDSVGLKWRIDSTAISRVIFEIGWLLEPH